MTIRSCPCFFTSARIASCGATSECTAVRAITSWRSEFFDDILHDRLLLPARAKAATLSSVACAGGNVERGDRAIAGARDCDRDVGGSPRYLVSGHRHEQVQRTLLRLPEMIAVRGHDGERPLKG